MFEISKLEFRKWLQRQAVSEMSIYEKTFVGIIIDHFDDIAQCGTTGGARAKLIGSYIEKLGNKAEQTELNMPTAVFSGERVKRLESLTVENFRGFGVEEHFDFSKQYTFITVLMVREKQVSVKRLSTVYLEILLKRLQEVFLLKNILLIREQKKRQHLN